MILCGKARLNCPHQQPCINNTVCFWPREKFISTSEDTKYKSWKIKRNKPLCHLACREENAEIGRVGGRKTTRGRKNSVTASRVIETEIQYMLACSMK